MAKSSKKQIDQDEKKVIEQLQRNSNESIDKIAKQCGFSRQKVWRIIKRLESNKTIWGYTAVPDKEKQGVRHYFLLIKRSNEPLGNAVEDLINAFKKSSAKSIGIYIRTACVLHGQYRRHHLLHGQRHLRRQEVHRVHQQALLRPRPRDTPAGGHLLHQDLRDAQPQARRTQRLLRLGLNHYRPPLPLFSFSTHLV